MSVRPHKFGAVEVQLYVGHSDENSRSAIVNPVHKETLLDFPVPRVGDYVMGKEYYAKVVSVIFDFQSGHVIVNAVHPPFLA